MAGNDDLIARLGYHHEHPVTGTLVLINPDGPEAATALAERDATIERLTRELTEASTDVETMLAEANALKARAVTAERELGQARAEVERLKQDVKATRAETSAVAKVLAYEPPYQASLAKRAEALVYWKEVNGSEIARLQAEVERKDAALSILAEPANWRMGGLYDPNSGAFMGATIARAALTAKGGGNGEG